MTATRRETESRGVVEVQAEELGSLLYELSLIPGVMSYGCEVERRLPLPKRTPSTSDISTRRSL
jgi:hypothetical protein